MDYRNAQLFVEGLSILRGKEFPQALAASDAMHSMKKSHDALLVALEELLLWADGTDNHTIALSKAQAAISNAKGV